MKFPNVAAFARTLACGGVLVAFPSTALAQAPPVDPFLGVSILTTGAATPGGAVTLDNTIDRTVAGGVNQNQPGLSLTNLVGGYDDSVLDPIRNFSAAPFTFTATAVTNADGTAAALGGNATGRRIDLNGNTVAGGGGTFTVNANGTFTFTPGTDFADLTYASGTTFEDLLAAGAATRVAVDFTLHGVNTSTGATRDFSGQLVVALTRQADNSLTQSLGSDFADYGSSSRPTTDHTIFPDLQGFVSGLLRYTFAGQPGSAIVLTNNANLTTLGTLAAHGISATTVGQRGYDGRDASVTHSSTDGEQGGVGGPVTVDSHGTIRTSGTGAVGIFAWSAGGDGGQGGDSGYTRNAKAGGAAGTGGSILVTGGGEIHTSGDDASGILALSQGGNGGGGGDGSTFNGAENGANGGRGGSVVVNGTWDITTGGAKAYGIWGKSFGGTAGSGGDGGWTGTSAGGGGQGTEGGSVTIVNGGKIQTSGADAYGIFGQSIGGFGGDGGSGTSIFYASGGSGEKAGSGGSVDVTNNGRIITTGARAHGIFAESIGGGGGQGGSGGALVGLGGSGAGGGDAGNVRVANTNDISATGAEARGIYAQSVGGGGGDGGSGSGFVGVGGSGSSTSNGGTVKVANAGKITSSSSAIFAQSVGGGGGDGGSSAGLISIGGDGGAGGNASAVSVSSHGDLTTTAASGTAVFAQSIGGGGGNGGNGIAVGAFFAAAIGGKGGVGGVGSDVKIGVNVDSGVVDAVTGTILTSGDGANGIQGQSIGGGGGNGGFAIAASAGIGASASLGLGGAGGSGNHAASASVYFGDATSRISTGGADANGILVQSVGGGGGNGGMSIAIAAGTQAAAGLAFGGDGGTGGDAGTVAAGSILNPLLGRITTSGEHSYGVLAQSVGGGGGNGGLAVAGAMASKATASFAFGGTGGNAGAGSTVTLASQASVETQGANSHGLFAQSIGGGGGSGGAAVAGGISGKESFDFAFGGSGGSGGASDSVTLTSGGAGITTHGEKSYGVLAQSIGGGGGDGGFAVSGSISGDKGVNLGIGGNGGAASNSGIVTLTNAAGIATQGNDSHGIFAQSVGGGGGSGGFSVAGSISKAESFNAGIGGKGAGGGNSATVTVINDAANLTTAGDRAYGILAQSIGGGGGDGGFAVAGGITKSSSVELGVGGNGAGGGHADTVTVTNHAAITTLGLLAHGIFAQSVGGGGGDGGFSISGTISSDNAMAVSIGGNGGTANYARQVTVTNTAGITTGNDGVGAGSYGILAQSIGGGGGAGGFSGAFSGAFGGKKNGKSMSFSIGGQGGSGENSDAVTVTNGGRILTTAADSVGIFAQSIGGGGGDGGFSLSASLSAAQQGNDLGVSIGGSGGSAGNGLTVDVTNTSQIETHGDHSQAIQAQSIGGGGGNGGFSVNANGATGKEAKSIGVSVGGRGGAGGDANNVKVTNSASVITTGNDSIGIQAQSLGGGGGNGGFSVNGSFAGASGKTLSISVGGAAGGGGIGGQVDVIGATAYTVSTQGDRSIGIQAQSVGGGGGNGGFSGALALGEGGNDPSKGSTSVSISVGGGGGAGDVAGAVNVGSIVSALKANVTTTGAEAVGIQAISLGGGGGNGGFSLSGAINAVPSDKAPNTDLTFAVGGGGGNGNNGAAVLVHSDGTIFTSGDGSHGIQAQSIGGGGGNGGSSRSLALQLGPKPKTADDKKKAATNKKVSVSVGGNAGGASDGSTVTVDHTGDITTIGGDAHGIMAQSIGGGGGTGGDANEGIPELYGLPVSKLVLRKFDRTSKNPANNVKIVVGGSGGSSGDANAVTVTNDGRISTWGDGSYGVFAQSIGGGGGEGGDGQLGLKGTVGVGGGTGSTGNGGTVSVNLSGAVNTYGSGAHAIFAQSIGGGGGAAGNVDRGLKNYANVGVGLAFGQGGGNGGDGAAVTVDSRADLFTLGNGANGIFAQSIGGGGGVAGSLGDDFPILNVQNFAGSVGGTGSGDVVRVTQAGSITTLGDAADGIFAQSAGGQQLGKAVTVTLARGDIVTYGAESNGIFAQSTGLGGRDNITVNVDNAASLVMGGTGTGAGVRFADGVQNTLNNHGTITTASGIAGTAIVGDAGTETVNNYGRVNGSVNLGAGANVFDNKAGALFEAGAQVNVGAAGTFNNSGTLSVGGASIGTTTVTGNFAQSGTPKWVVDIGNVGVSDTLAVSGHAQLGTSVTTVDLQEATSPTGSGTYTLLTAAQGGLAGANLRFGTMYGAMPLGQTFDFVTSDTAVQMTLLPSTGTFRWTGVNGGNWTTPFVNSASNWARTGDSDYVYGTPGQASDVVFANAGATAMGADFSINSLKFGGVGAGHLLAGGNTLTLIGTGGRGLTVDSGSMSTTVSTDLILGGDQSWVNDSQLTVNGQTIAGPGKNLTIDGSGATTISAAIQTGTGSVIKTGSGVLVLNGANTYSGGTTINGGTLVGDLSNLPGDIRDNAILMFGQSGARTFANDISGTGSVIKQGGGTLTLTGHNTFTGGTSLIGSTLIGTTASLPGNIANDGVVVFDQQSAGVYAGNMTGSGTFTKLGDGTLTLTGTNSFTGGTSVFEGLLVGNSNSLQGQILNNTSVVFDQQRAGTYAGTMTGSGTFIKQGGGTLTLTGPNTFTGGTAVLEGTLAGNTSSLRGNILDNAAVVFDQPQSGIYPSSIGGIGTLMFRGGGSFNVTGNSGGFLGTTAVAGARLSVNGWLGGSRLVVQQGGALGGNGIVPAVTLQSGSALAPGNSIGSLFVNGDATFEPGSSYQVETQADGPSDLTAVTGRLFLSGGTVDVRATGTRRYHPINRYLIAASNLGAEGTFAGVTSDASYLSPSLQYDERNAYLTLRRNDVDFRTAGTQGNQTAVAQVFNRLVGSATGVVADGVNAVYDLSNTQALSAFSSMSGLLYQYVAMNGLTSARSFLGVNMRHLAVSGGDEEALNPATGHTLGYLTAGAAGSTQLGSPSASPASSGGWWVSSMGGTAAYNGQGAEHGARSPMVGVAIGVDTRIGDSVTLGVSGGEADPDVQLTGADDKTTARMMQFGVYGRMQTHRSYFDGGINVGTQRSRVSRAVVGNGLSASTATSNYDGGTITSQVEYGYRLDLGRGITIAPQAGAQYGRLNLDGTAEEGAGFLSLVVPARLVTSARALAGVTVAKSFDRRGTAFAIEGRTSWSHEFNRIADVPMRFAGDSWTNGFDLAAPRVLRDSALAGATVAGGLTRTLRLFATVDSEMTGAFTSWTGNVGLVKSW
jgi:autotransporter-associated beta strand protein